MLPFYVVITVLRIGSGAALTDALIMNEYYIAFRFRFTVLPYIMK
mgnify:CR=1 FL=1